MTYRVAGHFYSDAEDYRDAEEIARWRARDPIARYRNFLMEQHVMDADALDVLDAEIEEEVDREFQRALADPVPDPATLAPDTVFAEAGT